MNYNRIEDLGISNILMTDSYKLSHSSIYSGDMTYMFGYFESRGGKFSECTMFGLQYYLNKFLSKPITQADIDFADLFAQKHGEPFDRAGWEYILKNHGGYIPVRIRAIKEGTVVPTNNITISVQSTDDNVPWIENYIETALVRLWYPSTIAIQSRESKKVLKKFFEKTSDSSNVSFSLHDFGSRGSSCSEQAQIGGAAHLLSFMGSDTIEGILFANHYYDSDMSGFSIVATEHSNVTSYGRDREFEFYNDYIDKFLVSGKVKIVACVSDSYDIFAATSFWSSGDMYQKIKNSGGKLVIRPDSGVPTEILPKMLKILEDNLGSEITVNSKGYKVLPPCLGIIQGDGINLDTMTEILDVFENLGWSAENIAFGSGGGLLMNVNRDTQRYAFKCSQVIIDGKAIDVSKSPITDPGKKSKSGRLDLIFDNGQYKTVVLEDGQNSHDKSVMQVVYENGKLFNKTTFEECRQRMDV